MFENVSTVVKIYINIMWVLVSFPKWGNGAIVQVECNPSNL